MQREATASPAGRTLLDAVLEEQRARWSRGDRIGVEGYLERNPGLREDVEAVLDLIYQEFHLRREGGESPNPQEYIDSFPMLAEALITQFALDEAVCLADTLKSAEEYGAVNGEPAQADAQSAHRPAPGPSIEGYELLGELGRGGMGTVYKARDVRLGRIVAIKTIAPGERLSPEHRDRFKAEAHAVASLRHPNIIALYAIDENEERPFISLEFAEGGNLAQRLVEKPMAPRQAAELLETLARAVEAAHVTGVIHRDLKPSNILLTADGTPKISDFGLAKLVGSDSARTLSGQTLGTPSYMAPEQAEGRSKDVGPAADVYALGAILYQALTGRPPFLGDSAIETIKLVTSTEAVPPRRLRPDVPGDLETICLRCLEKEPRRRYLTSLALSDDLRRFIDDRPIAARPVNSLERSWRWCRRNPRLAAVSATLAATVLVGGSAFMLQTYRHNLQLRAEVARTRAKETDSRRNYQEARSAIRAMLARLDDRRMAGSPRLLDLRADLRQDAMAFYEKILSHADSNEAEVRADNARALGELATVQQAVGRSSDSVSSLREALRLTEDLRSRLPGNQEIARLHVDSLMKLGLPLCALDEFDEARKTSEMAIKMMEPIAMSTPDDTSNQETLAMCYVNCGNALSNLQRKREALQHFQTANKIRERIAPSRLPGISQRLAQGLIDEGVMRWNMKEDSKAEDLFQKAEQLLLSVPEDQHGVGEDVDTCISLLDVNWSGLLHLAGRFHEAIARAGTGLAHVEARLKTEPNDAGAHEYRLKLHGNRALALMGLEKYADAAKAWRRVVELSGQAVPVRHRCFLALSLIYAGESADAMAQADLTSPDPAILPQECYDLACIYGRAANDIHSGKAGATRASATDVERNRRVEAHVSTAMRWLKDAAAKGLFSDPGQRAHAKEDDDLRILRDRPEFRQLIDQADEKK